MTVSECVANWLISKRLSTVFTLPGGMIAPIIDAIASKGITRLLGMHHEQGVGFAVDGFGRFHRTPGVGIVTAGPGVTNVLTGIASCYLDSVPGVFIAGQVPTYLMKRERAVRQFALQECDVVSMASPVVKCAYRLGPTTDVVAVLDEAHRVASSGRPGPVLVEVPVDIQAMSLTNLHSPDDRCESKVSADSLCDVSTVQQVLKMLVTAAKPLIVIGGGIRAANAAARFRCLAHQLRVPVACTVTALDVLPAFDKYRLGMIGMFGNRWVNYAAGAADVVLVLGSRLDHGTLGPDVSIWRRKRIFQVDCDPSEMKRVSKVNCIEADLGAFLDCALVASRTIAGREPGEWEAAISDARSRWHDTSELRTCSGINPNAFIRELSACTPEAQAYVVDCGQHTWWTCQSFQPYEHQRLLVGLGLGAVGFALPAAIGVAVGSDRPVIAIVGDAGFQFNIQELQTIIRNQLNIKIVVINNGCHGSVRQLQQKVFGGRYPTTVLGYDAPPFDRVCEAYGVPSITISQPAQSTVAIRQWWRQPKAALLNVMIDRNTNVYPNVAFGEPLTAMESLVEDS